MDDTSAWDMETSFWVADPSVYDRLLDPNCLMAFPALGIMTSADVLASLSAAPRWSFVEMADRHIRRPDESTVVLGYKALGQREGSPPYLALCTSTYRQGAEGWRLIQHHQSSTTA